MDPTLLAALDTAVAQFKTDADALVPAQSTVTAAQAAVTTANEQLTAAQAGVTEGKAKLQKDFDAVVAAALALGLTVPTTPTT